MPKTVAMAATITPPKELTRPSARISRNRGSTVTCGGTTRVASRRAKSRPRPRKRSLAKAYPAIELQSSETAVMDSARKRLLKKVRPRLRREKSAA